MLGNNHLSNRTMLPIDCQFMLVMFLTVYVNKIQFFQFYDYKQCKLSRGTLIEY